MSVDLASLIADELAAYSKEIEEGVDTIAEEVAEETVQELRSNSPKRYGKYAKNWRKKKLATGSFVVYNAAPTYRLTHLLENSHVLRNGGRSKSIVHIKPAEEKAIENFQRKVKELGR